MKTVHLTESQVWLVTRALVWLSSEAGESTIKEEFPHADMVELSNDLAALVEKLETT